MKEDASLMKTNPKDPKKFSIISKSINYEDEVEEFLIFL